jgi:hypothetical protein
MKSNLSDIIYLAQNSITSSPSARLPDGGIIFVRHPSEQEINNLYAISQTEISDNVAPLELVKRVYKHNADSFFGVYYKKSEAEEDVPAFIGYYGFLHLNDEGQKYLEDGSFDALHPDFAQLAPEGTRPAVIYVWAIVAKKVARLATPLIAKALGKERYGGVPLYAKASTLGGLSTIRGYGFVGARPSEKGLGDLFRLDPEVSEAVTAKLEKESVKWK